MSAKLKQYALGTVTAAVILVAVGYLPISSFMPSPDYRVLDFFYVRPAIKGFIVMALAGCGGAYAARVGFVGAAVALSVATWTLVVYFASSIVPSGEGSTLIVAAQNSLGLAAGIVGAVLGARFGKRLHKRAEADASDAA